MLNIGRQQGHSFMHVCMHAWRQQLTQYWWYIIAGSFFWNRLRTRLRNSHPYRPQQLLLLYKPTVSCTFVACYQSYVDSSTIQHRAQSVRVTPVRHVVYEDRAADMPMSTYPPVQLTKGFERAGTSATGSMIRIRRRTYEHIICTYVCTYRSGNRKYNTYSVLILIIVILIIVDYVPYQGSSMIWGIKQEKTDLYAH